MTSNKPLPRLTQSRAPLTHAISVVNEFGDSQSLEIPSVLAAAEADIVHIHSGEDGAQETKDFYFVIAVRDRGHLDTVLAKLRRTAVVIRAERSKNSVPKPITSP